MKRFLSLFLVLAMALSLMAVTVFAAPKVSDAGDLFKYTSSGLGARIESDDTVVPGQKIYVALAKYDSGDKSTRVKKASITGGDSDDKKIVSNSKKLSCERFREGGGDRWTFALITVNDISVKAYQNDGPFSYSGEITVLFEDNSEETVYVDLDNVGYEEEEGGTGIITSTEVLFTFEKGDEIDLSSESGNLSITGTASGSSTALLSCSTKTIEKIDEKYGDDNDLAYYRCTGTLSRIKDGKLVIDGEGTYKYMYTFSGNTLTDVSKYYDKDNDEFVIPFSGTNGITLATYVLSDNKLSGGKNSSSDSQSSSQSSSSQSSSVPGSKAPSVTPVVSPNVPVNPSTGAAL